MANPVVVVVLIAASEAHDPSTMALTRAAGTALGPDAVVVLREVEAKADPADAASKLHADAVATVAWTLADHRRARIQVTITGDGRVFQRDLTFVTADVDVERGRALGLAIAGMIPDDLPPHPIEAASPPPVVLVEPPKNVVTKPSPMQEPARFGFDLLALATTGPLGVGAGIGARLLGVPALRGGASMRAGRLTTDAWLRTTDLTLGIAPVVVEGRTSFAVRLEAGASHQSVTLRDGQGEEQLSRVVAHVRGLGETTLWASPSFGVGFATGVELSFGETRVFVDDARIGTIPRTRVVLEIVVRARR